MYAFFDESRFSVPISKYAFSSDGSVGGAFVSKPYGCVASLTKLVYF